MNFFNYIFVLVLILGFFLTNNLPDYFIEYLNRLQLDIQDFIYKIIYSNSFKRILIIFCWLLLNIIVTILINFEFYCLVIKRHPEIWIY